MAIADGFVATCRTHVLMPFFSPKQILTSINAILFTLLIKKAPLKMGIQGNNLHIFL